MGSSDSKSIDDLQTKQKPFKVFITEGFQSGRSTVLSMIKYGRIDPTVPYDIGFDFAERDMNQISMLLVKEGGRGAGHALRQIYYARMSGIIFVFDSTERERIEGIREELVGISEEGLQNKAVLILANKQDLPGAMTAEELSDKLQLSQLQSKMKCHLQLASVLNVKSEDFNRRLDDK